MGAIAGHVTERILAPHFGFDGLEDLLDRNLFNSKHSSSGRFRHILEKGTSRETAFETYSIHDGIGGLHCFEHVWHMHAAAVVQSIRYDHHCLAAGNSFQLLLGGPLD